MLGPQICAVRVYGVSRHAAERVPCASEGGHGSDDGGGDLLEMQRHPNIGTIEQYQADPEGERIRAVISLVWSCSVSGRCPLISDLASDLGSLNRKEDWERLGGGWVSL